MKPKPLRRGIPAHAARTCPHPKCSIVIDRRFLLCLEHWLAVPVTLRREVRVAFDAWRNDQSNGQKLLTLQRKQAEAIALVS